jgi:tryptophan synthase alpha chain
MNRIDNKFLELKESGLKAVVPYICAGDPNLETTEEIILALAENGADVIEVGVPFSDPMADGPSIQYACQRAIDAGTTLPKIFEMVKRIREKTDVPLVLFSYYNILFNGGFENNVKIAKEAGIDGMLIVDVPFEEYDEVEPILKANDLHLIRLVAPTTKGERLERILKDASGFVYCITVKGVTGARVELPPDLEERLTMIQELSTAPIVAGFGIASGKMAKPISKHSDGVVVGSAFVNRINKTDSKEEAVKSCLELLEDLITSVR